MAKYKNIGTMPLAVGECGPGCPPPMDVKPGKEFDADLSPEQEAFWLKTGSIAKLDRRDDARVKE